MTHLFKPKRSSYYNIRFRRTENGKIIEKQFSLKTSSKKIAQQLETRLKADQQLGKIDVFSGFNFDEWKNPKSSAHDARLLSSLIQKFLDQRTGIKEKSREHYKMVLTKFNESVGASMMIHLLKPEDIILFVFKEKFSKATQKNYLAHLKPFFKWVKKNGYSTDITEEIKAPKVPDNLKNMIISKDELHLILDTHKNYIRNQEHKKLITTDKQRQLWFNPFIITAFYTGIRQSELLNLRWKHIDFDSNQITVVSGKGDKSRTTVLLKQAKEALISWKKNSNFGKERYVFESVKSRKHMSIRMTNRTVQRVFKDFVRKANLSDDLKFHSLRHSDATMLLKLGFSLPEVQKIMGHSQISVTMRYVHLDSKDLNEKAEKLGLI